MAANQMEGKRNANMDMLRLLSMLMVTMLHALAKSDLLPFMGGQVGLNGWIAWVLEALSVSAVNIFMLISGYFLITSTFKVGRLIELVLQTLFYSAGCFVLFVAIGQYPMEELNIYNMLQYFFPIHMETYWFISAYVIIYMLLPVLASGVKALSEKQLRDVILWLLAFECIFKSVLPVQLTLDKSGYNFLWYLIVFLVGAYIRLHGLDYIKTAKVGWLIYGVCTVLILAEIYVVSMINVRTDRLNELVTVSLDYNHILVFGAAVGIFVAFLKTKPMGEKTSKVIVKLSPYCLGVYLLQENLVLRYRWQDWFVLRGALSQPSIIFVLQVLGAVVAMFALGILVDALRALLFKGVTKLVIRREKKSC